MTMVIEQRQQVSNYRWYILFLATITNTMVAAVPVMCLPVLFAEISKELHLSLVQVGTIWGISALPSIFMALAGGVIGDRFGPKRVLIFACITVGLAGALRGLAPNFAGLAATMFLLGLFSPFITMNTLKMCGTWFPSRQLGLASGVTSMGMALGFLISSFASATYLSPWLGGWRQVLFLYGGISLALALPWLFIRSDPRASLITTQLTGTLSLRESLGHVSRIRNVWLFGLTILGVSGCMQGTLGYLPLYLRGIGWPAATADGALASFHTISMICVIPIAIFSDRLGSRKKVLVSAGLMIVLGVGLLSLANGPFIWAAVLMAGMVRDGFMAVFMTSIIETEGVGVTYAGTAIGMVLIFAGIGNLLAPPVGNSLAAITPGLPFLFWAGMTGLGLIGLLATSERSAQRVLAASLPE